MSDFTPSRRAVVRTAAWSVPAVSLAAAAPSFAVSPPATPEVTYQNLETTVVFNPVVLGNVSTDPNNEVSVTVRARVPLNIPRGQTADPVETESTVTIPAGLAGLLGSLILQNPTEFDGTSVSTTELTGAFAGESVTNLTIPRTPFPASGNDLVVNATGTGVDGLDIAVDADTGTVTMTLLPPESTLVGYNAAGNETATYTSELSPKAGEDYTLGTFTIS